MHCEAECYVAGVIINLQHQGIKQTVVCIPTLHSPKKEKIVSEKKKKNCLYRLYVAICTR